MILFGSEPLRKPHQRKQTRKRTRNETQTFFVFGQPQPCGTRPGDTALAGGVVEADIKTKSISKRSSFSCLSRTSSVPIKRINGFSLQTTFSRWVLANYQTLVEFLKWFSCKFNIPKMVIVAALKRSRNLFNSQHGRSFKLLINESATCSTASGRYDLHSILHVTIGTAAIHFRWYRRRAEKFARQRRLSQTSFSVATIVHSTGIILRETFFRSAQVKARDQYQGPGSLSPSTRSFPCPVRNFSSLFESNQSKPFSEIKTSLKSDNARNGSD